MTWVSTSFAPGPQRVETTEHDPSFVSRPIGFMARFDDVQEPRPRESGHGQGCPCCCPCGSCSAEPLLWEGDQA